MAAKWDKETASTWEKKGKDVCGNFLREAEAALKKAKEREARKQDCV
jgi:hypothetical protein